MCTHGMRPKYSQMIEFCPLPHQIFFKKSNIIASDQYYLGNLECIYIHLVRYVSILGSFFNILIQFTAKYSFKHVSSYCPLLSNLRLFSFIPDSLFSSWNNHVSSYYPLLCDLKLFTFIPDTLFSSWNNLKFHICVL